MLTKSLVYFSYRLKTSYRYKKIKHFFYRLLIDPDSKLKSYFDIFMICFVMISVFLLVYGVEHELTEAGEFFEQAVVVVFISEYLLRGWLYSDSHQIIIEQFEKSEYLNIPFNIYEAIQLVFLKKLEYVFSLFAIIDLIAILPSYRPLRMLRILLIFRLFKLFRYSNSIRVFADILSSKRFELLTLTMLMGFLVFIASIAIYLFENDTSGGNIADLYDAVYWSIVTISTVGYGDITPQTLGGRLVTVALILTGLGVLSFFTSIIVSAFSDKMHALLENRTSAELSRYKQFVIICGFGRVGQELASLFTQDKQPFIIIDKDKDNIALAKQKHYLTIQDDATVNAVLLRAGIMRGATHVLCTTGDDVTNVYITLTSRFLNPDINIISRANREDNVKKLYQAGANNIIQPFEIAGLLASEYIGQPIAFEAILGILQGQKQILLEALVIHPHCFLENQFIVDIALENRKLTLVGVISSNQQYRKHRNRYPIKNQHFYFNPDKKFKLHAHDILVVLGRQYSIEYLQDQIEQSRLHQG